MRGSSHRPSGRLPKVPGRLVPRLGTERVASETLDLLTRLVGGPALQRFQNSQVKRHPSLLQEAPVGNLMRQRMLEGVLELREEVRFVEELGSLKVRETLTEVLFRILDDGLEQSERHVLADHGGSLEQALLRRWEPVDAPGQQRLHRRRDVDRLGILDTMVGAPLPPHSPALPHTPATF